jgi:hypothetical protein
MNSIEELQNLIELLKQALNFYANSENYGGNRSASNCCSGISVSKIEMDEGLQARFALKQAEDLTIQNLKIQEDYDRLMTAADQLKTTDDMVDPQKLMEAFKVLENEDNNIQ